MPARLNATIPATTSHAVSSTTQPPPTHWHLPTPTTHIIPHCPRLHTLPLRRAALEEELQSYPQLSEEQRAAALAEHERREREYSRLQRQRLCMDDFEPLKLIGKVGGRELQWDRLGGVGPGKHSRCCC